MLIDVELRFYDRHIRVLEFPIATSYDAEAFILRHGDWLAQIGDR
jgi:hypothetical protein